MARHTFFSFHYERDSWRAGQVRNCNVVSSEDEYGFIDAAEWEEIKKKGDDAIEDWVAEQLEHTSVTAVLVGAETADRPWVLHEIVESWNRGNGIVGIWIHNIKDQRVETDTKGRNPLDEITLADGKPLSSVCKTYDWVNNDGRNDLGRWIEEAFEGRKGKFTEAIKDRSGISVKASAAGVSSHHPTPTAFRPRAPWCESDGKRS
jgi:hypothetical protein